MAEPGLRQSTSDERITGRSRLAPEKIIEILGRREVKRRVGEHGQFVSTETGFGLLSQEERDGYQPTLEQLEEAEETLRLEDTEGLR
ncbi:hypothetical protein V1525DRAFT_434703 [Lipomyces kononenkoae]|uniref:Uncharacterized protein n=1 Tax=Lipomyces kononenkoae TaxID=34357 RepID=A0ACC3SUS4_LIPKO